MTQVNITEDIQALHAFETAKKDADSLTYFIMPDDSIVHEEDMTEAARASGDYWMYEFKSDELELLFYYLVEATAKEVSNLCHVLVLGSGDQDFHHALFCVLKEIGASRR